MKKCLLLLVAGIILLGFVNLAWAQDNGIPDTAYIEVYPLDQYQVSFPAHVRFTIQVTNDIPDPYIDSIAGMMFPLCFTSSNPAANARIEAAHNNTNLYPFPDVNNSIFRHLPSMQNPQERNWMMDLSERGTGQEWDTRILDLAPENHFWLALVPTGTLDQRFPGGSRLLTATMTFTLDDTTTICIEGCYWPPGGFSRIVFSRSDAVSYIPQQDTLYCISIGLSERGDANGDSVVNVADVAYMVSYLYREGLPPASIG